MRDARLESEANLGAAVRLMAEGVIIWSADGRVLNCNDAAEKLLGVCRERVEGHTLDELGLQWIHDDGTPFVDHPVSHSLRLGAAQHGVIMGLAKPDGSTMWVRVSTVPLSGASATTPSAVVSTFSDVTELRQREAHLVQAMNGANVGTWQFNHETGHVERNARWAATLGSLPSDIEPSFEDFVRRIHPDDRPQWESARRAAIAQSTPWILECRVLHHNGNWVWVQTRGRVVEYAADGSVRRTAGVLVDIDLRKRMEEQLRVSLAENVRLVQ